MPKCVYVEPSGEISQAHLNDDGGYIRLPFGESYTTSAASGGAAVVHTMPTDTFDPHPHVGPYGDVEQDTGTYQCSECDFRTSRKQALVKHQRRHSGEKPFQCPQCDFRTAHKYSLKSHMRVHTGEKPFECPQCDFRSAHKYALTAHMRVHTGESPFQCELCSFQTTHRHALTSHQRTHTQEKQPVVLGVGDDASAAAEPKPYEGSLGSPVPSSPASDVLDAHRVFACSDCDFESDHKGALMKHQRVHAAEKPFECPHCDFRASFSVHLTTHLRLHSTEKPFQCDVCDYHTDVKGSLEVHLRVHTGEKPYKCNLCDFRAIKTGDLTRHLRVHTGEKRFWCAHCDYRANQKIHLTTHLRVHSGEKPYSCEYCGYKTGSGSALTMHRRVHKRKMHVPRERRAPGPTNMEATPPPEWAASVLSAPVAVAMTTVVHEPMNTIALVGHQYAAPLPALYQNQ